MTKKEREELERLEKLNNGQDKKLNLLFEQINKNLSELEFERNGDGYVQLSKQPPRIKAMVDAFLKKLHDRMLEDIEDGIGYAFELSLNKQKETCTVYGMEFSLVQARLEEGLAAHRLRREQRDVGLNLSDRVWNVCEQTKAEFEAAMNVEIHEAVEKGVDAETLGRRVRHLLRHPDEVWKRFHVLVTTPEGEQVPMVEWRKRIIDEEGNVRWVKRERPNFGRGVYLSSRKNALRLARTETNMAYRYADCMAAMAEPMCIGIRISLSNNHTCLNAKGEPMEFHDMCDTLSGDYPKWFMWAGWHPNCRCHMTFIMADREERRIIRRLSEEEYRNYVSPNAVKDYPHQFNDWLEENEERILRAKNMPYFVTDNDDILVRIKS